jgi:hypothetical protein
MPQQNFPYSFPQATIANGAAVSNIVQIGVGVLVGMIIPAVWTTAVITFLASVDGVNFFEMYSAAGQLIQVTPSPTVSTYVAIGEDSDIKFEHFRGVIYLQLQSGTSASQVNQAQASVVTLVVDKSIAGAF